MTCFSAVPQSFRSPAALLRKHLLLPPPQSPFKGTATAVRCGGMSGTCLNILRSPQSATRSATP